MKEKITGFFKGLFNRGSSKEKEGIHFAVPRGSRATLPPIDLVHVGRAKKFFEKGEKKGYDEADELPIEEGEPKVKEGKIAVGNVLGAYYISVKQDDDGTETGKKAYSATIGDKTFEMRDVYVEWYNENMNKLDSERLSSLGEGEREKLEKKRESLEEKRRKIEEKPTWRGFFDKMFAEIAKARGFKIVEKPPVEEGSFADLEELKPKIKEACEGGEVVRIFDSRTIYDDGTLTPTTVEIKGKKYKIRGGEETEVTKFANEVKRMPYVKLDKGAHKIIEEYEESEETDIEELKAKVKEAGEKGEKMSCSFLGNVKGYTEELTMVVGGKRYRVEDVETYDEIVGELDPFGEWKN